MPQPLSIVRREPLTPPPVSRPARLSIVARAPLTEPYTAPDADPVRPVLADPVPPAVPDTGVTPARPREQGLATIGEQFWTKALQNARIAPAPKQPHPYAIVTDQTVKLAQDVGVGVLRIPKIVWGALRAVGDGLGLESVAEYATAASDEVDRIAASIAPDRTKAGTIEKGVSAGIQSLGSNAPMILAAGPLGPAVGGAVVLSTMGLMTAGDAYDRARDEGLEPGQAAVYAATDGLVEVLTEKIPMARLLGDLAKNSGLMTMLTRQLAAELPGEQVATLMQDANEWAHLNPEKTLSQFGAERPDAAVQTLIATVVGTVGQSAGAMAAQAVGSKRPSAEAQAPPPATPVESVPPTMPSRMPKAESHKLTVVKAEPLTPQAPTLPPEFAPVDAPAAEPVSTAPAVNPDEAIDLTDPVQAAQRMRAENPNIDQQAREMAERAREAGAPPVTEPVAEPMSTVPAPVAERMKANKPTTRQPAADYSGNVDDSPRVKNNEITRKHAFLMQWLADDMRQMPFEDSSRMRGIPAQDVTVQATSQEEARRAVYAPRVAGTPTQEMFTALGVNGSRAEIANQIENYLSGRSKGGKAVEIARTLVPIFEAAYDDQTKRFDFKRVPEDLYRRAGLTYEDMRAPVTGPREDVQPADLIAAFFPGSAPKSQAPEDVRARANAQVADDASLNELVEQYRGRMRRDLGNIVSRDNAKELWEEYASSHEGRRANNDAVADAAGTVAEEVYRRELKRPARPHAYVVLTAGGTGSGKTTVGTGSPDARAADVVFDSQGRDIDSMKRRIDDALASGRDVERIYVYRAPGDAWIEGVVKRAVLEGRPVGMEDHIVSHREALQAALALTEQYADDPRVRLTVVDNTGEQNRLIPAGEAVQFLRERLEAYNDNDVREAVRELTDLARDSGLIDEDLYAALTRGAASADRRGRGEGAERRGRGGEERSARAEVQGAERPVQGAPLEVTAREPLDVNAFGEGQARLPGAESVRDTEVSTPEVTEVPFSLAPQVAESSSIQPMLGEVNDETTDDDPSNVSRKTTDKIVSTLDSIEERAKQRIKERGTLSGKRLTAGLPLDDITDLAVIGAAKIAKGAVKFAEWSAEMIREFGESIREHLPRLFELSQQRAGMLADFDPDDYFNFKRSVVRDEEKVHLRAEIIETVVRTGRVPKERITFEEIRTEAAQLHPEAVRYLQPFVEAQKPYRAIRDLARRRINMLNREIVEARKALEGSPQEEVLERERAIEQKERDVQGLLDTWMRMRSEDGRNLAMHRMMTDSMETWYDATFWMSKAKRSLGLPPGVELPVDVFRAMQDILNRGRHAVETGGKVEPVQQELAAYLTRLQKSGWLEILAAIRKAGLLTGPKTHARNLLGNTAFQLLEETSRLPSMLVDMAVAVATGHRTIHGVSLRAMTEASREAATRGVKEAAEIVRTGAPSSALQKVDTVRELNSGIRWIDRYANFVFRTMAAEDRIFKSYAFRRSLEEQAALEAINKGVSPVELLAKPTPQMLAQATADAEFATFNNPNILADAVSHAKGALRRKGDAGKAAAFVIDMAVPFVNTPSNIIARMLDYTPVGATGKASAAVVRAAVNGAMTADQQRVFSQAIGRGLVGSALIYLGWTLAAAGVASGIGDEDEGDRNVREAAGILPGAVRVEGRWRQVATFSPAGNLVSLGASLQRTATKPLREEATRGGKVLAISTRLALEQPMLKGLNDLVDALQQPAARGEMVLSSTVGSFVPTLMNDVASAFDPYRRDARPDGGRDALWMNAASRLPGLRNLLPARTDILGRQQRQDKVAIWDPTIATIARDMTDPVLRELVKHDVGIGWPQRKAGESPDDYRRRTQLIGMSIDRRVRSTVSAPMYQLAKPDRQTKMLEDAVRGARQQVEKVYPVTAQTLAQMRPRFQRTATR